MTVRKILVAVDGSKPSIDASTQALDIAKKLGAELIALYVISPDIGIPLPRRYYNTEIV